MLLKIIFIVAIIDIRHVNCHFIDLNNKIIRNMLQNTEFCGIININHIYEYSLTEDLLWLL